MISLESELTTEEVAEATSLLGKIDSTDLSNIEKIIGIVDELATSYFDSEEHLINYSAFFNDETKEYGTPFFAVYLIGGNITKEGKRSDIDLLFATNMRYEEFGSDPLVKALKKEFGVRLEGELPDNYNVGLTKGKVLIRLTPTEGMNIDLNYVRSMISDINLMDDLPDTKYFFTTESEFISQDKDRSGSELARVPLFRMTADFGGDDSPQRFISTDIGFF